MELTFLNSMSKWVARQTKCRSNYLSSTQCQN